MTTPAPATPAADPTPAPSNQPGTPPEPTAPAPTPPEPAAPTQPEPATEPTAKAPEFTGEFDPDRAKTAIQNARQGEKDAQARAAAAEKKFQDELAARDKKWADELAARDKRLAAAFGWDTPEEKPLTPEELTAKLAEEQNRTKASDDRARQTAVELAVYKTAGRHGGDPDALLDSRSFANAIAKLDPASEGFDKAVGDAVKAAVDSNKKLAAKAPEPKEETTPAGGAPMDGAPGGKRQLGAADVARMSPEEIDQAVKDGRLKSYLGG
ncbi:hypothetical protein AB0C91_10075 [Streptomyces sp. NPDC048674]|uniref:hypothetical protein n=1 Tax=Streptomyces sp. NPDC048674 TaxID=3155491 RepID=UPI003429A217